PGQKVVLHMPRARLRPDKTLFALNAYSDGVGGLPRLRRKQSPVWTHMIATSPLSDRQREEIGWSGDEAVYDCLNRLHYGRLTPCGRLCFGGGDPLFGRAAADNSAQSRQVWRGLEETLASYFPPLAGIDIGYRWKGPVSVCADMVPTLGFLGSPKILYSCGFVGHGIPIAQLNGRVLAELALDRPSKWADFWMVNRRVFPWPPNPVRSWLKRGILLAMAAGDAWAKRR
ncbi:MAG: NAD(P)/FAD-dependent oxidoreductase, partial [Gammaproteobacteria bacterium]